MTKQEQASTTYMQASHNILDKKAMLKVLRQEGEQAATRARYATVGTRDEKLTAIRAAWVPFNEKIASVEAEIATSYTIADSNFDAWQGLN